MNNITFLCNKKALNNTRFQEGPAPTLLANEVLLKIDKYAFTSNNITYGVFGERLYWAFFPGTETEGIIPVWGYADVVESNNEAIKVGERFYGYYPMSTFLKVLPGHLSPNGFSDNSEHRLKLPPIYNRYSRTSTDPTYTPESENILPFFKPLFGTGFLCYHFLNKEKFYQSSQVILTSASSKTALGTACMFKQNQVKDNLKIIGLTSAKNVDFVKKTGFYDEILTYDNYKESIEKNPSIIIDFAGNTTLLQQLADLLNDNLQYASLIGFTDWQKAGLFQHPKASMFFAPDQSELFSKEWGGEVLMQRIGQAMFGFTKQAMNWLEITTTPKLEIEELYLDVLNGKVDPSKGYLIV